ncbi:hypothetical protein N7530_001441 [Penicillium desertorum]|uniref:Uncharacterized protein n=1 Tax=Penicillium desertorum TaxID=1303715 RepID=A0A9X0BWQ0_9EURO|nr:hypothetical protein N7530_001441 [Penicillium desertorum]
MSRIFPHTPYAEDQPFYHTILTAHVLFRGFQAGAMVGLVSGATRPLIAAWREGFARGPAIAGSKAPGIIRATGVGSAMGAGILAVALCLRMSGRTEIEWKDRSWRLLESKSQLLVDDWCLSGAALGAIYVTLRRPMSETMGWRRVAGGAGIGSLSGCLGYLGWKYLAGHKSRL